MPPLLALVSCVSGGRAPGVVEGPDNDPAAVSEAMGLDEVAVLLQLVDRQHYEPWLVGKMMGGEVRIREALAIALGRIGDPRGRAELERLVVDGEPRVRRAAAFALGLLEDWGAAPMLLWVAADPDPETGVLAVEALARLGVPLERVERALQEVEDAAERRRRLLPALFRFQEEARVGVAREAWRCASIAASVGTTAESECAGARDPEVRRWAAYALAREPLPAARPDLLALLGDADPVIRAWGAKALGGVGTGEDLTALRVLLSDPEPGPVIEALRAGAELVERGEAAPPADWRDELLRLLDDPRPGVRVTAIEAAGAWLLDEALGAILAARAAGGEMWEQGPALLALARAGDPRAGALTGRLASAEESDLRAAAASAAAALGDRASLRRLYEDGAIAVRLAVVTAALEGEEEGAAEWVGFGLADPSWVVRAATLEWLAEHPQAAVEELVTSAEEVARTDVWLAAVPALEARAESAGDERDAAVEALRRLAVSPQFEVRRAAVGALQALGLDAPAVGVVETGKTLSDYREIAARTQGRPIAEIATTRGAFRLRLACPEAPLTCLNFAHLAQQEYFDGVRFHRVVPNFVAQAGDLTGTGWGGPGYAIRDEVNRLRYGRGKVGMALSGPDSGGSQFFVTLSPQPHLDGRYTLFAEVVDGMDVVDGLTQGDRIVGVRVREPAAAATFANARRSTR